MERLRGLVQEAGAAALVVVAPSARDPFLAPFAGSAHLGGAILLVPRSGPARLAYQTPLEREEAAKTGLALLSPQDLDIARWARDGAPAAVILAASLERALQHCGLGPGLLLLAGHAPAGTLAVASGELARGGWLIADGAPLVLAWRKTKREHEVEEIRRVGRATAACMCAVARRLAGAAITGGRLEADGRLLTVGRLRAGVARRLADSGLDEPHGNLIAAGAVGAVPHNTGDNGHALRAGESLVVDLFPRGRLFADMTRTFCVGTPSPGLAGAHTEVHAALVAARAAAHPGVHGWALQELVCARFRAAGLPNPIDSPDTERGYVHGLGHGVGYEVHELPSFRQAAEEEGILAVGDVFTLEPGIYEPEAGYAVRLEDTYYLGEEGLECLTELPKALDPRAYI